SILKYSGASSYVFEGIVCYSEESKMDRLSVKEEDLKTVGAVSTNVAYTMAKELLLKGRCDIAISTTGLAGPNGDGSNVPVGTGYIGIGMRDGVHVYKRRFSGTREEITETAKNTALFLAIKKLKKL
ncbi:MAG: CinA family protein, partial [Clostridia bacterium]|nr:CinA family protein [Clostridia bacterium]